MGIGSVLCCGAAYLYIWFIYRWRKDALIVQNGQTEGEPSILKYFKLFLSFLIFFPEIFKQLIENKTKLYNFFQSTVERSRVMEEDCWALLDEEQ